MIKEKTEDLPIDSSSWIVYIFAKPYLLSNIYTYNIYIIIHLYHIYIIYTFGNAKYIVQYIGLQVYSSTEHLSLEHLSCNA